MLKSCFDVIHDLLIKEFWFLRTGEEGYNKPLGDKRRPTLHHRLHRQQHRLHLETVRRLRDGGRSNDRTQAVVSSSPLFIRRLIAVSPPPPRPPLSPSPLPSATVFIQGMSAQMILQIDLTDSRLPIFGKSYLDL